MIRAPFGNKKYWNEQVVYYNERIQKEYNIINQPSKNPSYRPQYVWDTVKQHIRFILTLYSSGKPITELSQHFTGLLDAWELSNKLADELKATLQPNQGFDHRHLLMPALISNDPRAHNDPRSWTFSLSNFNHYHWCFQLISLALLLDIEEDSWQRLLVLVGGEQEDKLLDMVIASRQKERKIGDKLLHKKPYGRLLKAIESSKEKQPELLFEFVDNWYDELYRKREDENPWWYMKGVPIEKILEMGNYFGYWCVESAVCVKIFNLDDSLCLKHSHYPKDFLHEDEPIKKSIWQNIKEKIF